MPNHHSCLLNNSSAIETLRYATHVYTKKNKTVFNGANYFTW